MLRYRADIRALAVVASFFAAVAVQWFAPPTSPAVAALFCVATCTLAWLAAVIAHNALHCPIFRRRSHNRLFQIVVSLAYGFPVSEYIPGHNMSHHRHLQTRADVMRTTKVAFGWNALNLVAFVPRVAGAVFAGNMRYVRVMRARRTVWFRQFLAETTLCWGARIALLAIDWRKAALYVILPHLLALWGITATNFLQHDGCDASSEYNHSRNFVGRLFNFVTFNNGYHTVHHDEPGLHWSLLPKAHDERVRPRIHPALEQPSLFKYAFRAFVWPGRRTTFDGGPVVVRDCGTDADWIPLGDDVELLR
jgi:fatty acid desaturase